MQGTLGKEGRHVSLKICDTEEVIFNEHNVSNEKYDEKALFEKNVELPLFGRTWNFKIKSNKEFRISHLSNQPLMILVGGIVIDILLFLLFLSIIKTKKRAIKIAKEMSHKADRQKVMIENTSRLASLGEMAGGIAHEINNPLTIILLNLNKLKKSLSNTSEGRDGAIETVTKIEETTHRISDIVVGMRSLARDAQKDSMEPFCVESIINSALGICREKLKSKGVMLEVSFEHKDLSLLCRKTEISQVIINLINNSVFQIENSDSPWIKVSVIKDLDFVKIRVSDSGKGISEEDQKSIFKPFFTTKKVDEGCGLGLSISHRIITEHKGEFYYDCESKNTTFVIKLPLSQS